MASDFIFRPDLNKNLKPRLHKSESQNWQVTKLQKSNAVETKSTTKSGKNLLCLLTQLGTIFVIVLFMVTQIK